MKKFMGFRVIENKFLPETKPKLKLDPDVPCTERFRDEMDSWLHEMFGGTPVYFLNSDGVMFVHPNSLQVIESEIRSKS